MKFIVSRTSEWSDKRPCKEAKRGNVIRVETRFDCRSPEEFDRKYGDRQGSWFSVGTNHRLDKNGYITRDRGIENVWFIEINTIEELIEFCEKYGEIVIGNCMWNSAYKEIEIYDTYRE